MSERTLNITSASYELSSWVAVFHADDGGNKIASVINIERLREIVAAADKDLALLVAREGGTA